MLAMFEKLINEHGSSTILKERIVQIKEQYEELDRKFNAEKEKNIQLNEQVSKLERELFEAKKIIDSSVKDRSLVQDLELKILEKLFDNHSGIEEADFVSMLQISEGEFRHYIDELLEKEFIDVPIPTMANSFTGASSIVSYHISPKGRKHVMSQRI